MLIIMCRLLLVAVPALVWNRVKAQPWPPQTNCPYEVCFCAGSTILCDDRYLTAVPKLLEGHNMNMATLSFDRDLIKTIPAGSLPSNLSEISLQSVPIETIDVTAFDASLDTLQTLTFSQAHFTSLPEAVFRLHNLKSLSVYETNIKVWDDAALKTLAPTLQNLNLDTVSLTAWPTWIGYFSHVTTLTVSGSRFTNIPDDAFDVFATTLTELGLDNNSLTAVPKAVSKLTALTYLSVQQNRIADISWLPQTNKLTTMLMNSNRIFDAASLSQALRRYNNTIYSLQLNDNFLTAIPDISTLTRIDNLDLTFNHISDPYSGAVATNLTTLKLENNYLPRIPTVLKTLTSLPDLVLKNNRLYTIQGLDFPSSTTAVDLGYNFIQQLSETSFPLNSSITTLYIYNNPLTSVSLMAFQNLPHLTSLDMRSSKLVRLPLAILSLGNLNSLDVSDCPRLVCTCAEKKLGPLIASMYPDRVQGTCGYTSVYIFFSLYSRDCPPDV